MPRLRTDTGPLLKPVDQPPDLEVAGKKKSRKLGFNDGNQPVTHLSGWPGMHGRSHAYYGGKGHCPRCYDTVGWRFACAEGKAKWRCRTCSKPGVRLKVTWRLAADGPLQRAVVRETDRCRTLWRCSLVIRDFLLRRVP